MSERFLNPTQQQAARIAGIGYLVIIACGIFAEFAIRSTLIETGDPEATAANILDSQWLFRLSIGSDLVMLIFDVLVGLALFVIFRSVSESLSLLAFGLRLVHAAVYAGALLTLVFAVELLTADYVATSGEFSSLSLAVLNVHGLGYAIGLVFFGVHLLVLGYLVYASGFLPRILGVLLMLASAGYLIDSFASVLLTNYADYETVFQVIVFTPAFIAELSFALWLLIKGVDVEQRRTPAPSARIPTPA
jgi:hypothetical protein